MQKKNKVLVSVMMLTGIGIGLSLYVQKTEPIVKTVIKGIGEFVGDIFPNAVASSFKKGVKFLGKSFKNVAEFVEDALKRFKECLELVPLIAQFSAEKAFFETGKAFLEISDELANLDPRVVGTAVGEQAVGIGSEVVGQGLKILGGAVKKTVNIQELSFGASIEDTTKGKVPEIKVKGIIFGQDVNIDVKGKIWEPKEVPKIVKRVVVKAFEKVLGKSKGAVKGAAKGIAGIFN